MLSKERKLEIYTERIWRLALDLALQSSMGGKERRGIAVVAEETRSISMHLYAMLENEDDDTIIKETIDSALMQLQFLSFNGWLEMLRVHADKGFKQIENPIAVILDNIKNVAGDIRSLFGITGTKPPLAQPELKHTSNITNTQFILLQATIGGVPFVENTAFVQETIRYDVDNKQWGIRDGYYNLRGENIPVIDCYARLNLDRSEIVETEGNACALVINTDWDKETAWEKDSARKMVLVDNLPDSFGFYSRFPEGKNVASRSTVFTDPFVRASWDTADGGQMLFLDWKALMN